MAAQRKLRAQFLSLRYPRKGESSQPDLGLILDSGNNGRISIWD